MDNQNKLDNQLSDANMDYIALHERMNLKRKELHGNITSHLNKKIAINNNNEEKLEDQLHQADMECNELRARMNEKRQKKY